MFLAAAGERQLALWHWLDPPCPVASSALEAGFAVCSHGHYSQSQNSQLTAVTIERTLEFFSKQPARQASITP